MIPVRKCGCCRTLATADVHLIDGVALSRKPGDAHAAVNRYKKVSDAEFRRWVARCRKLFPLSKTVRATLENPGEDLIGICWDSGTALILKVCPRLDRHHAAETLLHEWAHLARAEEDPDGLDLHDDVFWAKFGELYRAWHRTT